MVDPCGRGYKGGSPPFGDASSRAEVAITDVSESPLRRSTTGMESAMSPLTSECETCNDVSWVECGSCGRWFCGPCSRKKNQGNTACPRCYPPVERAENAEADGGDP